MPAELLLISDLDNTLLGDAEALDRFGRHFAALHERVAIVYASGRFFESIRKDVETTSLPAPLAVIGGVGSEIRSFPGGQLNVTWAERISNNWSAEQVQSVLADEGRLELQPKHSQSAFKVSYFLPGASPDELDDLQAKLRAAGLQTSLIYSSERDLDFLPRGANKGTAAAFVASQLGFAHDRVLVAGDSGNDTKMFEHDFRGIIVSNAHEELKRFADKPRVYLSPDARADGVRDGLTHWMGKLAGD